MTLPTDFVVKVAIVGKVRIGS